MESLKTINEEFITNMHLEKKAKDLQENNHNEQYDKAIIG